MRSRFKATCSVWSSGASFCVEGLRGSRNTVISMFISSSTPSKRTTLHSEERERVNWSTPLQLFSSADSECSSPVVVVKLRDLVKPPTLWLATKERGHLHQELTAKRHRIFIW